MLEWVERKDFIQEMNELLAPAPVSLATGTPFMPRGLSAPKEARLDTFGPAYFPGEERWTNLKSWWLHWPVRANTPNWDLLAKCQIEGQDGILLVEAKANAPEFGTKGKRLSLDSPGKERSEHSKDLSRLNHERIGQAIGEASVALKQLGAVSGISRDSHYQLANRLAFAWKLAQLELPVALVYLGFIGDKGIADAGAPFADEAQWNRAVEAYWKPAGCGDCSDKAFKVGQVPLHLLARARPVLSQSPPRTPRQRKG